LSEYWNCLVFCLCMLLKGWIILEVGVSVILVEQRVSEVRHTDHCMPCSPEIQMKRNLYYAVAPAGPGRTLELEQKSRGGGSVSCW